MPGFSNLPRPSTEPESEAEYDSDESEESEDSDYYSEEYSGSEEVFEVQHVRPPGYWARIL